MKRSMIQMCCAAALIGMGAVYGTPRASAAEFGENTKYYEDDAWYDITEWFDGNDYNPTDEAWWRWDNETYEASKDTGGDIDNDWYGYTTATGDNWYYDYYDPYLYNYTDTDNNELFEFGSRYYDYDKDGFYDAYAFYSDTDGDGLYDDFDYYSFNNNNKSAQGQKNAKQTAQQQSRQQSVTGQVQKTKLVQVPGGAQHVIVAIQPQQGQGQQGQAQQTQRQQGQTQTVIADIGRTTELKNINPKVGDKITVKGPQARIGKQNVILAKSVNLNGETKQVDRDARRITGKVVDTRKTKVRGQDHLIAMVEATQKGKTQKIAVDLGRADQLNMNINKGSTLTFSGFPVKVRDKRLVMAQSVERNNQMVQIKRQPTAMGGAGSGGNQQQGQDKPADSPDRQGQGSSDGAGAGSQSQP